MISLQSTSRSRFSRSTTRTRFLHITAISAAAIGSLFAQFDEKPEALSAKEWWNNANWLKTDLWEVRDRVETTDFDNHYVIDSIYGTFDAWGDDQLKKRIKEIQAIHRLREKGAARATSDGLVNETKKRINVAEDLAKTPVTTVLDVPRGARAIVRRAGAFQHRERRKGNYKGDGPLKSWLGVDDQKRQIAAKLGIDPYTDNLVLQKELDRVSTIGSLPELAVNYIDPGSGLFSVLESGRQSRMKDAYLNSPSELFVQNRRTLIEELGASKALAAQFLSVEFATPAQQTILVESLVQLKNTKNRLLLVQLANLTKTRAEFEVYRRCAELLAWYHSNRSPISKLTSLRWMPVGVDQSGNRVLPFPIDFGSWCPECGGFLTEFSETGEGGTLVMTGRLTERALSELAKRNVDVVFLDHEQPRGRSRVAPKVGLPNVRSMLIHSVYFWLDESLSSAQKAEFEAGMKALFSIDVVASGEIGTPAATPERPVTNNTFDYALFLKFEKVEDHNAYQIHPDHQVFVDNFSQWFKTVQIYDTEYA